MRRIWKRRCEHGVVAPIANERPGTKPRGNGKIDPPIRNGCEVSHHPRTTHHAPDCRRNHPRARGILANAADMIDGTCPAPPHAYAVNTGVAKLSFECGIHVPTVAPTRCDDVNIPTAVGEVLEELYRSQRTRPTEWRERSQNSQAAVTHLIIRLPFRAPATGPA